MGKYISFAGSLASIIALIGFGGNEQNLWKLILTAFAIIALVVASILEIRAWLKEKPKKYNRKENIDYMNRIIGKEGRVVVFAGDLSWVDNEEIKNTLLNKKSDLYLCVKHTARYLDEFKKAGVHIFTYGENDFSPKTHFTVIRQGSMNEKIAITAILDTDNEDKRHIYEIAKDDKNFKNSWIVYAAEDLFNLTKILNGEK